MINNAENLHERDLAKDLIKMELYKLSQFVHVNKQHKNLSEKMRLKNLCRSLSHKCIIQSQTED